MHLPNLGAGAARGLRPRAVQGVQGRGDSSGQGVWGQPGGGVGGGAPASRVQGLQAPVGDVGARPPGKFLPILLHFDNLIAPLTRVT